MANYTAHNSKVFKVGVEQYAERVIKVKLEAVLRGIAQKIADFIDGYFAKGDGYFPLWTANLHDATGVGVYIDSRLSAYVPTPKASSPQEYNGIQGIIGSECLQQALTEATTTFSTGIWFVLFSAVPYAYEVNAHGSPKERGFRFFDLLSADVESLIKDALANLKPIQL